MPPVGLMLEAMPTPILCFLLHKMAPVGRSMRSQEVAAKSRRNDAPAQMTTQPTPPSATKKVSYWELGVRREAAATIAVASPRRREEEARERVPREPGARRPGRAVAVKDREEVGLGSPAKRVATR
jgi:hypothetical protein